MDDRLVYVVECWSRVHRWDDANVLFGSFEGYTHCLSFVVAILVGRVIDGALPVGRYLFVM